MTKTCPLVFSTLLENASIDFDETWNAYFLVFPLMTQWKSIIWKLYSRRYSEIHESHSLNYISREFQNTSQSITFEESIFAVSLDEVLSNICIPNSIKIGLRISELDEWSQLSTLLPVQTRTALEKGINEDPREKYRENPSNSYKHHLITEIHFVIQNLWRNSSQNYIYDILKLEIMSFWNPVPIFRRGSSCVIEKWICQISVTFRF